MQKRTFVFSLLAGCMIFAMGAIAQAADTKVDPTGTWKWTMAGRNGGPDRTNTLVLKLEGDKLTGTVSAPGRNAQASETKIEDATLKGDEISFSVTREFNGNKMTSKYTGKVTADTIKGKTEMERNGQTNSRDWEAKREKK